MVKELAELQFWEGKGNWSVEKIIFYLKTNKEAKEQDGTAEEKRQNLVKILNRRFDKAYSKYSHYVNLQDKLFQASQKYCCDYCFYE